MKCLPATKIPQAQGNILHDWHAEVLAIRAFNRFVLDECKTLAQGGTSEFLRRRAMDEPSSKGTEERADEPWNGQPFTWKEDIVLHMYCSEAPCGDASMELTMASQEDATPWEIPPETKTEPLSNAITTTITITTTPIPQETLPGRAYFSHLGVVRRKPARPDAPPTLSKSCSDKLAQHQATSLLSSTTSLLVAPEHVYLLKLIMPASRHDASACQRAFSAAGRMKSAAARSGTSFAGGYTFRPFVVETTTLEFRFSQRSVEALVFGNASNANCNAAAATASNNEKQDAKKSAAAKGVAPSNIAAAWTASGLEETTLGGVLQGRKQSAADARGASFASRRKMWAVAVEIAELLLQGRGLEKEEMVSEGTTSWYPVAVERIWKTLSAGTYGEVKTSGLLESRRRAKEEVRVEALKGWVRNIGDESFGL
ncbi:hypothetical protein M426DRAFT_322306 [Hypoxylon sp. CI-4A]|nr:hypothetical protein M426DRAFT_322306 [Hypoxylon sp. CI-4A]